MNKRKKEKKFRVKSKFKKRGTPKANKSKKEKNSKKF